MKKVSCCILGLVSGVLLSASNANATSSSNGNSFNVLGSWCAHTIQQGWCNNGATQNPPGPFCVCVPRSDDMWQGVWECCDELSNGNTGSSGNLGYGGGSLGGGSGGGTGGGSGDSGCANYNCEANGYDQTSCGEGYVFNSSCPCDSNKVNCISTADWCLNNGYHEGSSCSGIGQEKVTCPRNGSYIMCITPACNGMYPCGSNAIGCNSGDPCLRDGTIYCANRSDCKNSNNTCSNRGGTPMVITDSDYNSYEGIDCRTNDEGMRNCDALGYLQSLSDCSGATQKLKCPFDENRYYCGGKISESTKKCSSLTVVNGVTIGIADIRVVPNTLSGCQMFSNVNIPLYNACISRTCTGCVRATDDYCVSDSSYPVYKLTCDPTPCSDEDEGEVDEEEGGVDQTPPPGGSGDAGVNNELEEDIKSAF